MDSEWGAAAGAALAARESPVWVNAATDAEAEDAVRAWLGHVEVERTGSESD